jgi:flagellar hook-associated protein 2
VGETAATRVLRNIQSVVSDEYSTGDTLNSLSLMGIETQSDGTLAIESDDLDDALDDYLDDVVAMFTTEDDGFSAAMREQIDVYTDPVDGTLESFKDSLESRVRDLEKSVSDYDYRIMRYEERLRNQFNSMESMLGGMKGTSSYMSAYLGSSSGQK